MRLGLDHVSVQMTEDSRKKLILHDLTVDFASSSITLIIGKTGSGKSTLLYTLAGLIEPSHGQVKREDFKNSTNQVTCGMTFQYPEHQLFATTVQGEFTYSLRRLQLGARQQRERINNALEQVGLPNSILERSPFSLSGGEKRRIALATTLVTDPDWLLLDEPTAALDARNARWLVSLLLTRRQQPRGGVIVVSHDLDTFLPIADRVIVMARGGIAADLTPEQLLLRPELLHQAGIGLPSCMKLAAELAKQHLPLTATYLSPSEMAEEIHQRLSQKNSQQTIDDEPHRQAQLSDIAKSELSMGSEQTSGLFDQPSKNLESAEQTAPLATAKRPRRDNVLSPVRQLDARAKWVVYVFLSIGIFINQHWIGISLSTLITAAVLYISRVERWQVFKMVRPFLIFSVIAIVFSGLQFTMPPSFAVDAALLTLTRLSVIILVMILGIILTLTTTQLEMKHALEQSLTFLTRFRLPVQAFALGCSLLLRFIPIISQEAQRLTMIVKARGGQHRIRVVDIPALTIPLLLSILQRADDLAVAMEVRGLHELHRTQLIERQLSFDQVDKQVMAAGGILLVLLVSVALFLRY